MQHGRHRGGNRLRIWRFDVVSVARQALVESAELRLRAGVDVALRPDGRGRVARLAPRRILDAAEAALDLPGSARAEFVWSFIFFGAQNPGWALAEIVALWLAIVFTIVAFARVDRTAAGLLVPYLAWVTFATALNATIARMNAA